MCKEPGRVRKNYYISAGWGAEVELGLVRLERSGELKAKRLERFAKQTSWLILASGERKTIELKYRCACPREHFGTAERAE